MRTFQYFIFQFMLFWTRWVTVYPISKMCACVITASWHYNCHIKSIISNVINLHFYSYQWCFCFLVIVWIFFIWLKFSPHRTLRSYRSELIHVPRVTKLSGNVFAILDIFVGDKCFLHCLKCWYQHSWSKLSSMFWFRFINYTLHLCCAFIVNGQGFVRVFWNASTNFFAGLH